MFVFTNYVSGLNQFSAKGQAGHGFVETRNHIRFASSESTLALQERS